MNRYRVVVWQVNDPSTAKTIYVSADDKSEAWEKATRQYEDGIPMDLSGFSTLTVDRSEDG